MPIAVRGSMVPSAENNTAKRTVPFISRTAESIAAMPVSYTHLLGPCIGQCCFETDDDVPEAMLASLGQDAAACLKRQGPKSVSYTHLDVYKRQLRTLPKIGTSPPLVS